MANRFKSFPSVSELLESPPLKKLLDSAGRNSVVTQVRDFLDGLRGELQTAAADTVPAVGDLAERIARWISSDRRTPLGSVINATGQLLHPGLGRSPLPLEAVEAVATLSTGYCTLEVDPQSGARTRRDAAVEPLLQQLTGAEAAMVVNNHAAAALLTLSALASDKQVLVARGQLVEVSGFKLAELIESAGARLRDVGAANCVRIEDYRHAIGVETAAVLNVQFAEVRMVGECQQPSFEEIAAVARRRQVPLVDILGGGALIDLSPYGVHDEPVVRERLQAGADLVLTSGDKLMGGPPCGLILGRRALIARLREHPLADVLQVGKLTLAALGATLQLYPEPDRLEQSLPLLEMLSTSLENLRHRAERLAPQLAALDEVAEAAAMEEQTQLGAALTSHQIPTFCVAVTPARRDAEAMAHDLRSHSPAVWPRVRNGRLLLDLRTVRPSQDEQLVAAFRQLQ